MTAEFGLRENLGLVPLLAEQIAIVPSNTTPCKLHCATPRVAYSTMYRAEERALLLRQQNSVSGNLRFKIKML